MRGIFAAAKLDELASIFPIEITLMGHLCDKNRRRGFCLFCFYIKTEAMTFCDKETEAEGSFVTEIGGGRYCT